MEDSTITPDESYLLFWINIVVSASSLVGEIFMIVTYYRFPALRTFAMKLVISLIVADIFYSISSLLEPFTFLYGFCVAEAFLSQIGTTNAVFWICSISYVSYAQVYQKKISPQILYNGVLFSSIAVSMTWSVIPLAGSFANWEISYGYSLAWCSVNPQLIYIISVFGPMAIGGVLCFYWGCKAYRRMDESTSREAVIQYKSLLVYPIILFITWIPGVADRIYNQVTGNIWFPLLGLHVMFARSQGIINAVYYGRNNYAKLKQEISHTHSDVNFAEKLLSGYDVSSINSFSPNMFSTDSFKKIKPEGSSGSPEIIIDIRNTPDTYHETLSKS